MSIFQRINLKQALTRLSLVATSLLFSLSLFMPGLASADSPTPLPASAVAMSADGARQVAVVKGGDIYTSSDSGATWTDVSETTAASTADKTWTAVAMSADGSKLVAVEYGGDIWKSTDYGATWTNISTADDNTVGQAWTSVAMSTNGLNILAGTYGAGFFTSTDSGDSWTQSTDNGNGVIGVAMSADSSKQVIVAYYNGIYISADSGTTWTNKSPVAAEWQSVAMSDDGARIVALSDSYDGDIWMSGDSGANWNNLSTTATNTSSKLWSSIAMSADGTKTVASTRDDGTYSGKGDIYTSSDSGATWANNSTDNTDFVWRNASTGSMDIAGKPWTSVAISSDGNKMTAIIDDESSQSNGVSDIWLGRRKVQSASLPSAPFSGQATPNAIQLSTTSGTDVTCASSSIESSANSDPSYSYPLGLVDFCFDTSSPSNQVTLTFQTDLTPNQVVARKYNPSTHKYSDLPASAGATITETIVNGHHALKLTYTITDNGPLDLDPTTGQVKDPIGLATKDEGSTVATKTANGTLADTGMSTKDITMIASILVSAGLLIGLVSSHKRRAFYKRI